MTPARVGNGNRVANVGTRASILAWVAPVLLAAMLASVGLLAVRRKSGRKIRSKVTRAFR